MSLWKACLIITLSKFEINNIINLDIDYIVYFFKGRMYMGSKGNKILITLTFIRKTENLYALMSNGFINKSSHFLLTEESISLKG